MVNYKLFQFFILSSIIFESFAIKQPIVQKDISEPSASEIVRKLFKPKIEVKKVHNYVKEKPVISAK